VVIPLFLDENPRPAKRQRPLPNRHPSLEPSQDEAESDSYSDDELNDTESDEDEKKPVLAKRKRCSS
jgi:hypothetical protein